MKNKINLNILIRDNIKNLAPYSSARDEFSGADAVFLDANENPYGDFNRYPDPYQQSLKSKISKLKNMDSDNIFLGNGSDEIIDIILRIFCEPKKDEILIFPPTYGMYEVSADINDVAINRISLNEDFQIDLNKNLDTVLSKPKLKIIFICSPNNPTGNLIQQEKVQYILENFNGIVVVDEAYIDFSDKKSWLDKISEHNNLVVMQTLSKFWGMAGLRIGICFANHEIIKLMNRVKPPYNISIINQKTALELLENQEDFQKNFQTILLEKEKLIAELSALHFVEKIFPSDANFVLVKVSDSNRIYRYLVQQKVIVRNRHSVVGNSLRITIGTPEENTQLIKSLKSYQ